MPKRKRSESVNISNNWLTFGIDGDCDLIADNRPQTDGYKDVMSLDVRQQSSHTDVKHSDSDHNHMAVVVTTDGHKSPDIGQLLSTNLDENHFQLRRKSNRISKPIQRSLDSMTTANNAKIVKQNHLIQNVSNCDSDKGFVKTAKPEDTNQKSGSKGGKSLRKLQMWTNEDTKCFFEAISEHGKDFPRIQSYMAQRCEKKGIPQDLIKNYEQVRHYYYRMWHKIANSLTTNEVVDKNIQEIYGLINYGEIWKKFGSKFDNKLGLHLQQLVNFGHTTFKVKGKSVRVKTPICKALKKIHKINVSESNQNQSLLNLPKEVCIELHPADNESWLKVHSLSQNPRVRTRVSLQRRLSVLVEYLEKRWNRSRIKDSECRTLCGTSLPDSTQVDDWCLRVRPHSSGDLNNVSLSKSLFNSQMDLSLTAYLKTLYNDEMKGKSKKSKTIKSKENKDMKSPNSELTDSLRENDDNNDNNNANKNDSILNKSFESESKSDDDEPIACAERSMALLKMLEKMNEMSEEIHATDEEDEDQNKEEEDLPSPETSANVCLPEPPANATLGQWLSVKDNDRDDNDVEEDNDEKKTTITNNSPGNQISILSAERARKGWSLRETGSMTIGELYLLFRCPKTIQLEYFWELKAQSVDNDCLDVEECVVSGDDFKVEEKRSRVSESPKPNCSDVLHKLLTAANVSLLNIKRPANSSGAQTQKKKRIKPTTVVAHPMSAVSSVAENSSQLLSSVISKTIFNDSNSNDGLSNKTENSITKAPDAMDGSKGHNFIIPTSPAPKTNRSIAVNKTKNRTDPALIQEALRQLQTNKYCRRQRRPTPKPVFGQNKPLLPRGSPPNLTVSTATTTVPTQQPIYVIPSHPLAIKTITAVTSNTSVLTQTLPVMDMTGLNANHLNSDSFDVILPQKRQQIIDTNIETSVVDRLINSSQIPLIHIEQPIPSVSVPIISSSTHGLTQTLSTDSYPVPNSSSLLNPKSISLFEMNERNDKKRNECNIEIECNSCIDSNVCKCIENNDKNENISNIQVIHKSHSNDSNDMSDKMPLMSSDHTISSLLEISLPEPPVPFNDNSCSSLTDSYTIDKRPFERLTLPDITPNSNRAIKQSTDPTLPTSVSTSSSLASPPIERHKLCSPMPDSRPDWLNGESCDLSIGTLLNTCESPVKTVTSRDNPSLGNDVDTNMSCLVTDNSVDLISKFSDLAAHVLDNSSKST